jgi:RNA-directed DNA polymerase
MAHTDNEIQTRHAGFDFLGFDIRRYRVGKYSRGKPGLDAKTLIKPSKDAVKKHLSHIKTKRESIQEPTVVIQVLNPIIRGWCNDYKTVVSQRTFNICRQGVYDKLLAWVGRKTANRTRKWTYEKYYIRFGSRLKFSDGIGKRQNVLMCHDDTKIVRHVKVKGTAWVYAGNIEYWSHRLAHYNGLSKRVILLLKAQQGLCGWCRDRFNVHDLLDIKWKAQGGADTWENLQLRHANCHDAKHANKSHSS